MAQKKKIEALRYPKEIIDETTDYLQIEINEYSSGGSSNLLTSGVGSKITTNGTIFLPIPSNLQDTNNVSYGEDELNTLVATGLRSVYSGNGTGLMESTNPSELLNSIENTIKTASGTAIANKDLIMKALSAQALSVFGGNVSINSLLARGSGQILNPNMELLFNNVTLRTFRFSFKITPRNRPESTEVKQIIRTLKENMSARGNVGNNESGKVFLETPRVFQLKFRKGNKDHPFLNKFKPCFLKDMSVNYTGENVYATYDDGTPVSMTMDLTFQEMFPIYAEDYDNIPLDEGVGY